MNDIGRDAKNSVSSWKMVKSRHHRGDIPEMSTEEREVWLRLSFQAMDGRITDEECELLGALNKKLRYRIDREIP